MSQIKKGFCTAAVKQKMGLNIVWKIFFFQWQVCKSYQSSRQEFGIPASFLMLPYSYNYTKRQDSKNWTSITKFDFGINKALLAEAWNICIPKPSQKQMFNFRLVQRQWCCQGFFSKGRKFETFKDKKFSKLTLKFLNPAFCYD